MHNRKGREGIDTPGGAPRRTGGRWKCGRSGGFGSTAGPTKTRARSGGGKRGRPPTFCCHGSSLLVKGPMKIWRCRCGRAGSGTQIRTPTWMLVVGENQEPGATTWRLSSVAVVRLLGHVGVAGVGEGDRRRGAAGRIGGERGGDRTGGRGRRRRGQLQKT